VLFAATHGRGMFKSSGPLTSAPEVASTVPEKFALFQNYPNPFNPETTIPFLVPARGEVRLTVYDMTGKVVAELIHGVLEAGQHAARFNASHCASGVYLYELAEGTSVARKKLVVLK